MKESDGPSASSSRPDNRAVWRWHFYAGPFGIPLVGPHRTALSYTLSSRD
jgi:hypothetical protein